MLVPCFGDDVNFSDSFNDYISLLWVTIATRSFECSFSTKFSDAVQRCKMLVVFLFYSDFCVHPSFFFFREIAEFNYSGLIKKFISYSVCLP